jgi:hypothetical protein
MRTLSKKLLILPVIAGLALGLAACSSEISTAEDGTVSAAHAEDNTATKDVNEAVQPITFSFPDDSTVNCLFSSSRRALGLSCDWDSAGPAGNTVEKYLIFDDMDAEFTTSVEEINGQEVRCINYTAANYRGDLVCDL